jgi:hypothetical protein
MVQFAITEGASYVIAITRDGFDWKPIPLGAETLSQRIAVLSPRARPQQGQRCNRKNPGCSIWRWRMNSTKFCLRRSRR